MRAAIKDYKLVVTMTNRGLKVNIGIANTLRRAEMILHRWAELECGDGNNYQSWAIERDEATGKPFMTIYPHDGKTRRYAVADREAGALRRVAALCKELNLHFYHQTDPRGCALYISTEPLTNSNYSRGIPCCI